jgi:hypothetical protein
VRRAGTIALALSALVLLASCAWRAIANDAKKGAAVGFAIDGPTGAAIGAIVVGVGSACLRLLEKRNLRQTGQLVDKRTAITVKTAKPPRPSPEPDAEKTTPSDQYPTQDI